MNIFEPASVLLPRETSYEKWAVCAPDQYVLRPAYWEHVRQRTEGFPSVMHMMIPDAERMHPRTADRMRYARETMQTYLREGRFRRFDNTYIYTERTLKNGAVRAGLIGAVDLEAYDDRPGSMAPIRPAEEIDGEYFQSRLQLRSDAILEFSDVRLLCDDRQNQLLEPFSRLKAELPVLYDFDLMENGGRIAAWLVQGDHAADFDARLSRYTAEIREKHAGFGGDPMLFAVGAGTLTMAAAKKHYEDRRQAAPDRDFTSAPCRYVLAELQNLYDPAVSLDSLQRVVTGTCAKSLLTMLQHSNRTDGRPVKWIMGCERGILYLDRARGTRSADILQDFLDDYLGEHPGKLDFVTGHTNVEELTMQPNAIGFLTPPLRKEAFFPELMSRGCFPRRSFSLGAPNEARYCLEGRRIR